MTTTSDLQEENYESAVQSLFSPLHINKAVDADALRSKTIEHMQWYWKHIDLPPSPESKSNACAISKPSLIHITGTKGKGSTACFCESILRSHGLSTGLFTSPHLIDIRERLRWNGNPIHPNMFAHVYWKIRRDLEQAHDQAVSSSSSSSSSSSDTSLEDLPPRYPGYFRMLTLMAVYTFSQLIPDLDVMILEVGVGGRFDSTNAWDVVFSNDTNNNNVRACGVTVLDLDHTSVLGNTLEKIAWQKGAIFAVDKAKAASNPLTPRPLDDDEDGNGGGGQDGVTSHADDDMGQEDIEGVSAQKSESDFFFILDSNTEGVVSIMRSCAQREGQGGTLELVDDKGSKIRHALRDDGRSLGIAGEHQFGNATLAVQLCRVVIEKKNQRSDDANEQSFLLHPLTLDGLEKANWPARCQTIHHPDSSLTFRLDGAHTYMSMSTTVEWFQSKVKEVEPSMRVLVFNCHIEKNPIGMLRLLVPCQFSRVYFTKSASTRPSAAQPLTARKSLQDAGIPIQTDLLVNLISQKDDDDDDAAVPETWQETLASLFKHLETDTSHDNDKETDNSSHDTLVSWDLSVDGVLEDLRQMALEENAKSARKTEVLVTGSLYLVGNFLTALNWSEESSPDCCLAP